MKYLIAHLKLMRPANIVTAIADIMLGFAASGATTQILNQQDGWVLLPAIETLGWLMLSTIGLYGGGVVFNDVFDAELDKIERPERPIPQGLASIKSASLLGSFLLLLGIVAAYQVSLLSAFLAFTVSVLAVVYDAFGKHHNFLGPLNMGLCRSFNLLLGISAVPAAIGQFWYLSLIPLIYIAAITMISRGEVHGGSLRVLQFGLGLYTLVIGFIIAIAFFLKSNMFQVIAFTILFTALVFPPLFAALRENTPKNIGKAVKAGVIALISLDAALAAVFAGWTYCLIILALLPISFLLGKAFAVT